MTKYIIALSICLILTGAIAQTPASGAVTVPSQGAKAATTQMTAADSAVTSTNATLAADMVTLDGAYTTLATDYNAQQTARAVLANNVANATNMRMALTAGQNAILAAQAQADAVNVANARATAVDACVKTTQTWNDVVQLQVTQSTLASPKTVDLVTTTGAYQLARTANKLPSTFSALFADLTTHTTDMKTQFTTNQNQYAGVMKNALGSGSAAASLWTTFLADKDQTKLLIDPDTSTNGWNNFHTKCVDTVAQSAPNLIDCGKAKWEPWQTLALSYVGTKTAQGSAPKYWNANGQWNAWTTVDKYQTSYSNNAGMSVVTDVNTITTNIAGVLSTISTAMGNYKTQAQLVQSTLKTALSQATAAVSKDTDATTGTTKLVADALNSATSDQSSAADAVASAMAEAGAWGAAKKAVSTAVLALPTARTGLATKVNAQWTAQVALAMAQAKYNNMQQVSTDSDNMADKVASLTTQWQSNDVTVNKTYVSPAQAALKTQVNSTNFLINPKYNASAPNTL